MHAANILEKEEYFTDKCETVNDIVDCSERNSLFNAVYTSTNLASAVATVLIGIAADRWGMVFARSIGGGIVLTGLILMSVIMYDSNTEGLLWVAWPCLGVGGMINHIENVRSCRSIPVASATLMSLFAGCFAAGGGTMMIIDIFETRFGIDYYIQFAALAALFGVNLLVKLILWTPLFMPDEDVPFSLYRESWLLKKLTCSEETAPLANVKVLTKSGPKIIDLFKSWLGWQQ